MHWRLAALLLGPWLALLPWPAARPPAAAVRPFKHGDHVASTWFRAALENQRDCRGCHVYEKGKAPVDPQAIAPDPARTPPRTGCDVCHAGASGTFKLQAATPFDKDLSRVRELGAQAFEHGDHLRLTCRECHRARNAFETDPLSIQPGSRACGECHADGGRRDFQVLAGATAVDWASVPSLSAAGFAKVLDERLATATRPGTFRHQDHLAVATADAPLADLLAGKTTCMPCHQAVREGDATALAQRRFAVDACGDCHVGKDGALQFATEVKAGTSASALTFAHGDHVRVARTPDACSDDARIRLAAKGCGACHGFAAGADGFDAWSLPDQGGKGTPASAYEGCVVCHTPAAWRTKEHGKWERCEGCHAFPSAVLKDERPATSVRRSRDLRFKIEVQAHPFITLDASTPKRDDCAQCHKAPVGKLPSRIAERAFDHATHPTDCARCHQSVVAAVSAEALGMRQPGQDGEPANYRNFDLARCGECHRGGAVAVVKEEFAPRAVPRFAHADHIAKPGEPAKTRSKDGGREAMTCATCHSPVDGGVSLSVPDAKSCAECHGHDQKRAADTSDLGADDTASCGKCHGKAAPARDALVASRKLALRDFPGGQVHDPAVLGAKSAACDKCHIAPEPALSSADHVFAADPWTKDEARHAKDDGLFAAGVPTHCEGCHWEATSNLKQLHAARDRREIRAPTPEERAGAMGASLQLFPGPNATPFVNPPR